MATLGGATVATPAEEGGQVTARDIGTQMDMADGSLRVDHVGTRRRFLVQWRGVTGAEKSTLWTRYLVKTSQTWVPPEGGSYTVVVVPDSWQEESMTGADGNYYYDVSFEMEEAAAA